MSREKEASRELLEAEGVWEGLIDADAFLESMLSAMDAGLQANGETLAMIPTYVTVDAPIPAGVPVAVMDAGGTNLRVCKVTFDEHGEASISSFSKHAMPGVGEEMDGQTFFDRLAECLLPVLAGVEAVGFCFSYPSEILPDGDGRLLRWTKEVRVEDVVGQRMGAGMMDAVARLGGSPKRVVLLNDTVATLVAGKSYGETRQCSSYAGYILGTGTNSAYVEQNANITKLDPPSSAGRQVLNLESGNFNGFPMGAADARLDAGTVNPGAQQLEKLSSGAYLGPICEELFRTAAAQGLLQQEVVKALSGSRGFSTIDMSRLLSNPHDYRSRLDGVELADTDLTVMYWLADGVLKRAAKLAALHVAGAVLKGGGGSSPLHPVCVTIDGSTYYKTPNLQRHAQDYLDSILGARGIAYETVYVEKAPIIGAAIAGLTCG